MKRPKSTTALPEPSMKSSGLPHRLQIQFGNGAMTYVATTSKGRKLCHSAEERMTRRKPIARICISIVSNHIPSKCYQMTVHIRNGNHTNERIIIVFSPCIAIVEEAPKSRVARVVRLPGKSDRNNEIGVRLAKITIDCV